MDIHRDGNLIEACVWFAIAGLVSWKAFTAPRVSRRILFLLATTMMVFGASDFVEMRTGAWWRPWWLLVWKVACVITLLGGFVRYFHLNKALRGADSKIDRS